MRQLTVLVVIAGIAIPAAAVAQSTSGDVRLRVSVVDPSGAVIVGAQVTISEGEDRNAVARETTSSRGEVQFSGLVPGTYGVRVEAAGFSPAELPDLRLGRGEHHREVQLAIASVVETIDVGRDPQVSSSDARSGGFDTVLDPLQIAELPDDPTELEELLKEMAGPGAVMRVNGFRGGRLPPKDQIQQIRFRRNMFAADTHEAGAISVDIQTRPGLSNWRGSSSLALRDDGLNARQVFAPVKGEEELQRAGFTLSGPLWRQHTSMSLSFDGSHAIETDTISAALPSGPFAAAVRRPNDALNLTARVEHALSRSQAFRAEVQLATATTGNLGVGQFDLPERGYGRERQESIVRGSVAGSLGGGRFNELRLQFRDEATTITPLSQAPAIIVAGAFAAGGAQRSGRQTTRRFELADDLDLSVGRHALRAGALLEYGRSRSSESRNAGGTFTFASLNDYLSGTPATFSQNVGDPDAGITQVQTGLYLQDDIRITPALTISAGVRQEYQSQVGGLHLAPRAGLVWSPFRHGRTTVRGGAGLFFDWLEAETSLQALQLDGRHQTVETVLRPGYPDPTAGGGSRLPWGRVQLDERLRQPERRQLLVGVEQQLFGSVRVMASLLLGSGEYLPRAVNVNAPDADGRRPDATAGPITEIRTSARSRDRGFSVNLNYARPEQRLFIAANYMLGRVTDERDDPFSLPANNDDLPAERGPASNDARHRFMSLVNIPLGAGVRLGSSLRLQSGLPYNITTGGDENGDAANNDRPAGVTRNSRRGPGRIDLALRLSRSFGFGPRRDPGSDGPQIRIFRGDNADPLAGMSDLNLAARRFGLEFYAQAYNLTNHLNATAVSGVVRSPFFGQPTAAAPARRIEIGWRLTF